MVITDAVNVGGVGRIRGDYRDPFVIPCQDPPVSDSIFAHWITRVT